MTRFCVLLIVAGALPAQNNPSWTTPHTPFRVFGNTYYVGTKGLSSVLVTSPGGDVLIDGDLAETVPQITSNIRKLGFRIEDVKLIVNSHAHFDHAGGIAELQRLSGARVVASKWSAEVMTKSGVGRDDPQYGEIHPVALVAHVETLHDGESFQVGALAMTAHLTPGHTPGGTSWTWKSCESGRCLDMVYADSLSPVSAKGFEFTKSKDYPDAIQDFEKSFAFLSSVRCDILITPHPDASHLFERVQQGKLVDQGACRTLADHGREALKARIAAEAH